MLHYSFRLFGLKSPQNLCFLFLFFLHKPRIMNGHGVSATNFLETSAFNFSFSQADRPGVLLLIQHDSCKSAIKSFLPVVSRCYVMGEPVVYMVAESGPPGVPIPIQKRNTRLLPSLDWRCIHVIRSLTLLITPLTPNLVVCVLSSWRLDL